STLVIVPAAAFPSAPAVTAVTPTVAWPSGPIIVTVRWVANFLPASVLTIKPLGRFSVQRKQLRVKVTFPDALAASICFWPVAVPGIVCDWLACTSLVAKWSGDPAVVPGAPSKVTSALIGVPDTDSVAVALGRYRMPTSNAAIASALAP